MEIVLRFVMQREGGAELEGIVELAAALGADSVDFTHCDVVREVPAGRPALFAAPADARVRELEKALRRARKRARKLDLEVRATSFVPEEQPVCAHDPRFALFVRHDGSVSPCQNLGIGGSVCFLGTDVELPVASYGRLIGQDLLELWRSQACREVRDRFAARVAAQEEAVSGGVFPLSVRRLSETLEAARAAMPEPPAGCRSCRHLYDL
ncbi:MAG: SPASM domain-containing protein [Planctomycetes bacterium]|nr:SPASM domain-containing protein [Planctomycetota bacterium]